MFFYQLPNVSSYPPFAMPTQQRAMKLLVATLLALGAVSAIASSLGGRSSLRLGNDDGRSECEAVAITLENQRAANCRHSFCKVDGHGKTCSKDSGLLGGLKKKQRKRALRKQRRCLQKKRCGTKGGRQALKRAVAAVNECLRKWEESEKVPDDECDGKKAGDSVRAITGGVKRR